MTNTPDPIDVHVGARIKLRRKAVDMPQIKLASHLGLTFQQVQKYERGANRVSASKLYEIAKKLGVGVEFFFEGLPETSDGDEEPISNAISKFLTSSQGTTVALLYAGLNDAHRSAVLQLLRSLNKQEKEEHEQEEIDADDGYY